MKTPNFHIIAPTRAALYCFGLQQLFDQQSVIKSEVTFPVNSGITITSEYLIVFEGYPNYTGVVQDMIDPVSEEEAERDRVTGYTIRQIEDALNGTTRWEGWKDAILELYENETEHHLEALFEKWN